MAESTQHWLVRAAVKAGLGEDTGVQVSRDADLASAWERVAEAFGVDQPALADAVARAFRIEVADFKAAEPTATKLLPGSLARERLVYPLRDEDHQIVVATADPTDMETESAVGFASGRTPVMEVAPPKQLEQAIEGAYTPEKALESLLSTMDQTLGEAVSLVEEEEGHGPARPEEFVGGPVVRLTNSILADAIDRGASDIHIQPVGALGVVRFRVDGLLHTGMQMPLPVMNRIISRIKVMAQLDIAIRIRPQDGRARIRVGPKGYDLRISTVPMRDHEKCVIRVLDTSAATELEDTGIPDREVERIRKLLRGRDGIFVVTGPTGSGKTTTIYAALRELDREELNIMTVEDPVEYELPGLAQIQVETKKGVTFASALRAILRQDPDVIFVGEIRDAETAEVASQAALTGHLVLATLHTNDAVGAVRRLTDLELDASTVGETLRGVLAQRLVRQVCERCAVVVEEPDEEERRLADAFGAPSTVRAVGCDACRGTGYQGRLPVVEVFSTTSEIGSLIESGSPASAILASARKSGMRTLLESAVDRVMAGETTLQEVERVLGDDDEAVAPTAAAAALEAEEELDTPRILVVDDDGANRTITRALMEREGYSVEEAEDGQVAMELLDHDALFSLVVLDLDMPRVDGREVLTRIRNTPATASLPVVVLTGMGGSEAEIELLEQGADDYISKPVDPGRFMTRVKAVLRRVQV